MDAETDSGKRWRGFLSASLAGAAVALLVAVVGYFATQALAILIVIGFAYIGMEVFLAFVIFRHEPWTTRNSLSFFKWSMIVALALGLAQCTYFFISGAFKQ